MAEGDIEIGSINMGQSMAVAACMVGHLIASFGKPDDTPDNLRDLHLVCLATFLHQLLMIAKNKDKVAAILEILIVELKDAQSGQSSE